MYDDLILPLSSFVKKWVPANPVVIEIMIKISSGALCIKIVEAEWPLIKTLIRSPHGPIKAVNGDTGW
jgi:hypothetical protein